MATTNPKIKAKYLKEGWVAQNQCGCEFRCLGHERVEINGTRDVMMVLERRCPNQCCPYHKFAGLITRIGQEIELFYDPLANELEEVFGGDETV